MIAAGGGRTTRLIVLATVAVLLAGFGALAGWQIGGDFYWVQTFFLYPGALFLVGMGALELWLSLSARGLFSPGEPLRQPWSFIAAAALCHFVGAIYANILSQPSLLNPLNHTKLGGDLDALRRFGLLIGGPLEMSFLACGLGAAVRVYRRLGLGRGLKRLDWVLLAVAVSFTLVEMGEVVVVRWGKAVTAYEVINWTNDPLLCVLLAEAILIRRAVQQLGAGLISRCWGMLATAVFLTTLGDLGLALSNHGYIPWPLSAITWYIWFPAAAAYSIAPAYQLEAVRQAYRARTWLPHPGADEAMGAR